MYPFHSHQVIDMLKFVLQDPDSLSPDTRDLIKTRLMHIFDEGFDYYNHLLKVREPAILDCICFL